MLIVIGGPTASGKSEVCCRLAKSLDGEVISADSMCVYRHMNIGTAKPLECMKEVRHHLIDIVEPGEVFDAKLFEELSLKAIEDIRRRKRVPIVCGGTYLYLQALLYGIEETPPPDWRLRDRLYSLAEKRGKEWLYEKLKAIDPLYAKKVSPSDVRRVVRALEVFINSGKSFSSFHRWQGPRFYFVGYYIRWSRHSLDRRIEERVSKMLELGLLEEIKRLLELGFERFLTSPQAINYKEFLPCVKGEKALEDCLREAIRNTKEYARRQERWFRRQGWKEVDMERLGLEGAVEYILSDLRSSQHHRPYPDGGLSI